MSAEEYRAPPLAVFDCGVFLQAVLGPAAPAGACLNLVERGVVRLAMSEAVLSEIEEVLERPDLKPRRRGRLTTEMTTELLRWIGAHSSFFESVPRVMQFERDPDDEPYLNLAIVANAHYLVSRDKDLLDLEVVDSISARELRHHAPGLSILNPVAFLQVLAPSRNDP